MSHSGRRALAETAATLSGGGSYKQHGTGKKTTSKKPTSAKSAGTKKRGGGGYGHGHKQKGGNCDGTYEFTQEQANVLFLATDMHPNSKSLNNKVMNAILNSLGSDVSENPNKLVKVILKPAEKSLLRDLVFTQKNQNLASIVQGINLRNARNVADQTSVMNQLEIRLNRYNLMKNLKEEHLTQLQNQLNGLRTKLEEQDKNCTSKTSTTPAALAAPVASAVPTRQGGKKSSFLKKR